MLENNSTSSVSNCKDCAKNRTLIKKYEKLTHLYQKKQLKLSMNGSSCISNGKTTNYTLDSPTSDIPCLKLVQVLSQLVKNKCIYFFRLPLPKSAKKLILLNICNRINKCVKTNAFNFIKQSVKSQKDSLKEEFNSEIKTIQKQGLIDIKNNSQISVTQSLITETIIKPEQLTRKYLNNLKQLNENCITPFNSPKLLQRRNMELQIINKKLSLQNKTLRECLVQLDKRQTKQNEKKRETLEQLAQQMSQKNQELQHLRQALKAYEDQDQFGKVLEHDIVSIKKQVDDLQRINDRLNFDLQKIKNQLFQTSNKFKQSQQKYQTLSKQFQQINKTNFSLTYKLSKIQNSEKQYAKLIKLLEKKLKRLNIYEKQIQQTLNLKINTPIQSINTVQQLKSQIILMFLANINNEDYKLHSQKMFDEQQKNLLFEHRKNWKQLQNRPKSDRRNHINNDLTKMDCLQISEIQPRGDHVDSVLNAWDYTRQNIHEVQPTQNREGTTMRILQLELQNNKQIGKITQLKEKMLHVRVIILKLLKSLELQGDIKPEAKDILRVLFDLFQYSQQQRENLFAKKKKLFGFI